ncbi:MAG: RNA polymerase sigma factor, partial [Anaerolineae bacterium]|nr:RNA polymerase sigma factor [Anaerolineae bacterium]
MAEITRVLGWTPTGKTLGRRIEAFVPRLFRIARSWGCNAELAHELVQETVVTALSKIKQLRKESALESWLISILANSHRGHL